MVEQNIRLRLLSLISLFFIGLLLFSASPLWAESAPSVYIVREGDTLWDISNSYFHDPYVWSELWKDNKYIRDPQWIYPGQPLLLNGRDLVPVRIGRTGRLAEAAPGSAVIMPSHTRHLTDRDQIDSCGYILPKKEFRVREEQERWGSIIDAKKYKISYSFPDLVYINRGEEDVSPGDRLTVFRAVNTISHPKKRKKLGRQIHILGIIEVQEVLDKIALAKITKSFSEIHLKDRVSMYQEMPLPAPCEPSVQVQGMLVAGEDHRVNLAVNNIVFLDRGKKHAVEAGNCFSIYRIDPVLKKKGEVKDPLTTNDIIGELIVLRTEEDTSTALITRSKDFILAGDRFATYRP
jgi:hypothetical protein